MLKHLTHKKTQKTKEVAEEPEQPVLTEDDEAFLQRIAEEGTPPPLPARPTPLPQRRLDLPVVGEPEGNDAQLVLYEAKDTPLPEAPDTPIIHTPVISSEDEEENTQVNEKGKGSAKSLRKKPKWSFLRRDSRDSKRKSQKVAATDLISAAERLKPPDAQPNEDGNVSDKEAQKEEQEMTNVLEQLNLAAVNNRVFSMSKESQELLRKYVLPSVQALVADLGSQIHTGLQGPCQWSAYRIRRPRVATYQFRGPDPEIIRALTFFSSKADQTASC